MSLNKVQIIGRLGNDPEVKFMPNGNAVANLTVATSEKWKDKNTGQTNEKTEWHRVVIFGKLAEIAWQYLKKGSQVYLEGKLQTRKWTDNNGVEKYTTEIIIDVKGTMQMLDGKSNANQGDNQHQHNPQSNQQEQNNTPRKNESPSFDDFDDDIPF